MRLITRANLDGIGCGVLITRMESIEQVVFAHPQYIPKGTVEVEEGDIIANLPFHPKAGMWFSNNQKAESKSDKSFNIKGKRGFAPSTTRLVYDFYDSPRLKKFEGFIRESDRIDNANLTIDDVLNPEGWVLLSYTLDPFMGLAAYHGYAFSVMVSIQNGSHVNQILDMPEVRGRIGRYRMDAEEFKLELVDRSTLEENVIVTDLRETETMPVGNRFLAFALFPDGNVQVGLSLHNDQTELRVRLGKSIFNRTCEVHLGRLAEKYGGGGVSGAAGLSLDPNDKKTETYVAEIIEYLKENAYTF